MSAFWSWLTRRTSGERWLAGLLVVVVALLIWVWCAWKADLEPPMATDYGTVADWFTFGATAAGFGIAVYTLRKNARDEVNRHKRMQRLEAARVTTLLYKYPAGDPIHNSGYTAYRLTIRNGGSSPVTEVSGYADYTGIPDRTNTRQGERTIFHFSAGVIAAGGKKDETFEVSGKAPKEFTDALSRAISFCFRDAEGDFWTYRDGKLRNSPPDAKDQVVAVMSGQT